MKNSKMRCMSKAKEQTVDELALEIVSKAAMNIGGCNACLYEELRNAIALVVHSEMFSAISYDYEKEQAKMEALGDEIFAKAPQMQEYENCQLSELAATEKVHFALGFATAVRLLGK